MRISRGRDPKDFWVFGVIIPFVVLPFMFAVNIPFSPWGLLEAGLLVLGLSALWRLLRL